jgi:hypothetical protein
MPLLVRLLFVWFFNMCVSGVNENVLHNVVYPLLYLGLDYPNMHPNLFPEFSQSDLHKASNHIPFPFH